eukprot:TRINITY_DN58148_c0_g1_i1.p1 TRINITY_DN58148_c0_g1~~TRINITY_DN58148_c0_g1_i1.p1  ORF type:complete len:487 (-),score=38.51 TRINITY_DN58148_c0_g1_i1:88-1377(-)
MELESGKCTYNGIEFEDGIVSVQAAFAKFVVAGLLVTGDLEHAMKRSLRDLRQASLASKGSLHDFSTVASQLLSFTTKIAEKGDAIFKTVVAAVETAAKGAVLQSKELFMASFSTTPNAVAVGNLFIVVRYFLEEIRKERKLAQDLGGANIFAVALHTKSECVSHIIEGKPMKHTSPRDFKPEVADACRVVGLSRLSSVLSRSQAALLHLFRSVGRIGNCLFTTASESKDVDAWYMKCNPNKCFFTTGSETKKAISAKVQCTLAVKSALYKYNNHEGILLQALKLAEFYGIIVDELLAEPYYQRQLHNIAKLGDWFKNESGVLSFQVPDTVEDPEERNQFEAVTCQSTIAVLHGFAETFQNMASALPIWMRSYGRQVGAFFGESSPCRKVFHKLAEGGDSFCKDASNLDTPPNPCPLAWTQTIWQQKPK